MIGDYYYGTGRRKSATARVFLKVGSGKFEVNGKLVEKVESVFMKSTDYAHKQ